MDRVIYSGEKILVYREVHKILRPRKIALNIHYVDFYERRVLI